MAIHKKKIQINKPFALKKVLRQGRQYLCGVCRQTYPFRKHAEQCLVRCLGTLSARGGVQDDEDQKGARRYRCGYCKRLYDIREQAVNCAETCKKKLERKVDANQKYLTGTLRKKKKRSAPRSEGGTAVADLHADDSFEFEEEDAAPAAPAAPSRPAAPVAAAGEEFDDGDFTGDEVDTDSDLIADDEFAGGEEDGAAAGGARGARRAMRGQTHKYSRDGRKLFCNKCGEQSPTIDEVIACYDSHPEKVKSGKAAGGAKVKKERRAMRGQTHKYTRDGRKLFCNKCGEQSPTIDEVIACYDSHSEESKAAPAAVDDKDMFSRDGAKYVCAKCQQKYFTRAEVVGCYQEHVNNPGGATSKAAAGPAAEPEAQDGDGGGNDDPSTKGFSIDAKDDDKFVRDGAKYVCRQCNEKFFTRMEVISCYDGHFDGSAPAAAVSPAEEEATPEAATEDAPEEPSAVPQFDGSDDDKFVRDGAKYVCKRCNEKYFTRMEVITCHDSH